MSMNNICECGCGKKVKSGNRFIDGHNRRGRHHSKKPNQKNSDAHLGKSPSKETREKTSKSLRGKYTGKDSSQWRGGISSRKYPLKFSNWLKNCIRERDNYTCQLCGKTKEPNGYNLSVHHIDYNKENNNPKNLITLCRVCNIEVESDREVWVIFFQKGIKYIYKQIKILEKRK